MLVQEGEGWRLQRDDTRTPYCWLIGGADWATELTAPEARALRRAVDALLHQHSLLADGLMAEESITLELEIPLHGEPGAAQESAGVWMELEGDRERWRLRWVLTPEPGGRAFEGTWAPGAAAAFAAALLQLEDPPPPTAIPC